MQQKENYKKLLGEIISKSNTPTILEVGSDYKQFISDVISFSKKKDLFIHATNSNIQDENHKKINYQGFTFSKIKFGKNINENNKTYNLDLIFSYLKWSKIDLLKINQNEYSIDILKGAISIFNKEHVNITLIETNKQIIEEENFIENIIEFSKNLQLDLYVMENNKLYILNEDNKNFFDLKENIIIMKRKNFKLGIKVGKKQSLKDIIFKDLAKKIGHLPFFRGQDRLVRYFYPPDKFKNLNKGEIFFTKYFGIKYKGITSNYIDWGVYFKGGHEKGLIKLLKKEVSNYDIFLDIGANSGTISLPFIFEEKLTIFCFEPLSYSFNKLKTNFEINDAPKRHKLINTAISNQSGMSNIYFSKTNENPGFASIDNYFDNKDLSTEEIKLNTIDNLIKVKNKNIIFKIDVEGYEKQVIDGAQDTLKNNNVLMYLECRDKNVIKTLENLNFKSSFFKFAGENINYTNNEFTQDVILKNFN